MVVASLTITMVPIAVSIATRGSTRENGIVIVRELSTGIPWCMMAVLLLLLAFQFQAVNGLF